MSWIEFVFAFVLLGAVVAIVARFRLLHEVLHVIFGLARVECRTPRLTSGVSAMMPAVVREPLEHVACERWKYHGGNHESKMPPAPDGTARVERWP